jgi:hypothetical protein
MVIGHLLLALGSLPAVLLGDAAPDLVTTGQDVGFLGAMVAALGALGVGLVTLRPTPVPTTVSVLFVLALPAGVIGTSLLSVLGSPEDYLGLPLTVLYGGAFVAWGAALVRGDARQSTQRAPSLADEA